MLALSRKETETVNIYDPAGLPVGNVSVVRVQGGKVVLGFDFIVGYGIRRAEIDYGHPLACEPKPGENLTQRPNSA